MSKDVRKRVVLHLDLDPLYLSRLRAEVRRLNALNARLELPPRVTLRTLVEGLLDYCGKHKTFNR